MVDEAREVRLTCTHDCPDACSTIVTVEAGRAVGIRADDSHPVTGRHLCSKVDRYLERVYDDNRLTTPLRRTGNKGEGSFAPIGWGEAIDTIADRWTTIIDRHGAEAILPFSYLGNMGALSAFGPTFGLFNRLGASQLQRAICGGQALAINAAMGAVQADPEEVVNAELIICWGIDVVATSIHFWDLIRTARRNGARLVVIDPYRSATAKRADDHLAIRPGTDGALALALVNVMLSEDLVDRDFIESFTNGVDDLAAEAAGWSPEAAAEVTGLTAAAITDLARTYAAAKPASIRFGVGMQRAAGAGMAVRAIQCLPALAGHWRHRGGGIVNGRTMPLLGFEKLWGPGPGRSRSFNMIQLGQALTDPDLDPAVQALFVWNSNPAVIAGDQNRIIQGLERQDLFTVVHDLFLTDTARYADIVLPATTQVEQNDLMYSWGHLHWNWNPKVIEPLGEAVSNNELFRRLAGAMGLDDPWFSMTDDEQLSASIDWSAPQMEGITLDRLKAEGTIRLNLPGPDDYAPHADGGFPTPSGKVELSASMAAGGNFVAPLFRQGLMGDQDGSPVEALPTYTPPGEIGASDAYPLALVSPKAHAFLNSQYSNMTKQADLQGDQTVTLHAVDAADRGLTVGDRVRVFLHRGSISATVKVDDDVAPGVALMPMGHWPSLTDGGLTVNALTNTAYADIGRAPTFSDTAVQVEPI